MQTLHVELMIKDDGIEAFIEATLDNAHATLQEEGCLRFDVFQDSDVPNRFLIIEQYSDDDGMNSHFQSEHFQMWRAATDDLIEDSHGGPVIQLEP